MTIPTNKQRIHLIGQSAEKTIISWNDYAKKAGSTGYEMGTSATSTVFLYGSDFLAENLTFQNTAGEGKEIGQACAITVDADRVAFINCRFIANQDTIYTYGKGQRQYFRNCWIEGTTDFIFGASTCWFEDCTILSKRDSYITAASTPENEEFGYVFMNCRLIHKRMQPRYILAAHGDHLQRQYSLIANSATISVLRAGTTGTSHTLRRQHSTRSTAARALEQRVSV